MDFDGFKQSVVKNIKDYLPERYINATVTLQKVIKNNDLQLTGLMVMNEESNIAPNIYLDEYYKQYVDGEDFSDIMRDIANVRISHEMEHEFDISRITELEQVKDKIICKLVNKEMNKTYLADKPYTPMEDLAVIYAIDLGRGEGGYMSAPITMSLMEQYGITTEELHNIAIKNLLEAKVEFKTMRDVLIEMLLPDGVSESDPRSFMLPPEESIPSMYVLTNADKINGASAVLDRKVMEDISDKLGGDFIVIPSSIHEVIILPITDEMDRQTIENMIKEVNAEQVEPEERLSDYAYQYDAKEHELVRMDRMEKRKLEIENKGGNIMSDMEFVTIDLSKKQVDYDSARKNEKNGKEYVRIYAPGGGVFFYPLESLKENKDNENRVHFSRPVGTEITLSFSERNPDVPDDAPASEKYVNSTRVVKIEDLKEMYKQERAAYAESQKQKYENSPFVNVTVPTEWGREFSNKEKNFISISVPIKEEEKSNYYSFVIPAESFKESTKEEGMSYFGFPRKRKDSDEDYMITLKRSEKQENGEWKDVTKEISSVELVAAIKRAKEMQKSILEIEVSEKLLRPFKSHDEKSLVSVSIPVYEKEQEKEVFFSIVIPESRVSDAEKEGQKKINISEDYEYTAKRSILDESSGNYNDVELKLSGSEIKKAFKDSKDRYAEQLANESIKNEKNEQAEQAQQAQNEGNSRPHVRRGR